jgi:hypothetical protein
MGCTFVQGLPFAIAGVGDLLALFRCVSCRYRFSTDATRPALMGAIGRVYSSCEVGAGLWLSAAPARDAGMVVATRGGVRVGALELPFRSKRPHGGVFEGPRSRRATSWTRSPTSSPMKTVGRVYSSFQVGAVLSELLVVGSRGCNSWAAKQEVGQVVQGWFRTR